MPDKIQKCEKGSNNSMNCEQKDSRTDLLAKPNILDIPKLLWIFVQLQNLKLTCKFTIAIMIIHLIANIYQIFCLENSMNCYINGLFCCVLTKTLIPYAMCFCKKLA